MSTLSSIFFPKSIAVVGASTNPEKLGYACVNGILKGGYQGKVYPINPNAQSILGLKCLASADDLPENVDLAIVMLPAEKVPGVLETLVGKAVKGALIPAGGFAETGERGTDLQRAIESICMQSSMRVLGPNIPGFINADASLVATLAGGPVGGGPLAIVSQAGSVGYAVIRGLQAMAIRFGRFICLGNQVDVSDADIIEFLAGDSQVRAIGLYIESVKDGRHFIDVARRASAEKPIVVFKGGRMPAGLGAIFSHTASVSSPERIYRAAFRKAGILEADSLRVLGMLTFALAYQRPTGDNRIVIVTSLAGMGVIASDACEKLKLKLPVPSEATKRQLRGVLPPMASLRNPIDLTGDVSPAMLARTIEILTDSGEYDGIIPLVMGVPGSQAFGNLAYAQAIEPVLRTMVARGMVASVGWVMDEAEGAEIRQVHGILHAQGVPVSEMPEDAAQIMAGLIARGRIVQGFAESREARPTPAPQTWTNGIAAYVAAGKAVLTEHMVKGLLEAAGIKVASSRLATSPESAAAHARAIGFPVALKIQSAERTHKSEVGGVALGLCSEAEVSSAFDNLVSRFRKVANGATLDGISVQPLIRDPGIELVCGISEDPQFGKYVMVGLGGVSIELLEDFSLRLLPVDVQDVEEMLAELKSAPLLAGYRGCPLINRRALVRFVVDLCRLAQAPEVAEVEINPILATEARVLGLDARMRLHVGNTTATSDEFVKDRSIEITSMSVKP